MKEILNLSLLNIIANYISPNCLKILMPCCDNAMTIENIIQYLSNITAEICPIRDDRIRWKFMNDYVFIVMNLNYYVGKVTNLSSYDIIDCNSLVFDNISQDRINEMFSHKPGECECYDMRLHLLDLCVTTRMYNHVDNIYQYIKKCLVEDSSGKLFYYVIKNLPERFYNKFDFPEILKFILNNLNTCNSEIMDLFINDTSERIWRCEMYNFIDIFMNVRDKLSKDNINKLISCTLYEYAREVFPAKDYGVLEIQVRENPDKYMKLALAFQEFCKHN